MARNSIAPGGYIGGEPPRRPMFNQLSGVWKLDDVLERQKNNAWTNALGVEDVFSTYLYTGNGSTQTITNGIDLSGKGGLVWNKSRSLSGGSGWHFLYDTTRGVDSLIASNDTTPYTITSNRPISSFNSNGFTTDYNASWFSNNNGSTYASWTFRKAAKFFDIVTYTGNGGTQNIAHNLGSAPGCIIIKSTSSATNWIVYHRGVGATQFLQLNQANAAGTFFDYWNNTAPTSTQFTLGAAAATNTNGETYVAYLFAHDAGGFGDSGNESVIKCGSFQDGPSYSGQLVDLGWEPQWVMIKRIGSADVNSGFSANWQIYDVMRGLGIENNLAKILRANTTEAEISNQSTLRITSQGFVPNLWVNTNDTYVYIAIRRGPMKAPTDATKVFKANAYTGNGSLLSITGAGFPPDFSFTTRRDTASWVVTDKLRGASLSLYTQATDAEVDNATFEVRSYDQNGITYGQNSVVNSSSSPHVNYLFRRAPGFFDVVAYTGTGPNQQIAHSLGVVPEMMIIKSRNGAFGWAVYHSGMGTDLIELQSNIYGSSANPNWWDNGAPTSTLIKTPTGSNAGVNRSGDRFVAYLFASCPGVSKVGVYTGTGAAQTIDCGFTNGARFVMIRRRDSGSDWSVWDSARGIFFGTEPQLRLNTTAAETTNTNNIEPASVGFAISNISTLNANGGSYLFLAIA